MVRIVAIACSLFWASLAFGQLGLDQEKEPMDPVVMALSPHKKQIVVEAPSLVCDTVVCDEPSRRAVLAGLVGIEGGAPLNLQSVNEALKRLKKTGYFEAVTPQIIPVDGGISLVFVCTGQVIITDIEVEYTGTGSLFPKLFASEIRKRLPYRKGGRFPAATPDGYISESARRELSEYVRQLVELYSRRGYEGTKMEVLPEYYGPGFKKVRVKVRVTEGQLPEIGQVLIKGNSAFDYWRILSGLSTGEHVDLFRDWLGSFGIARYDRRKLKKELAKVEQEYREDGYVRARVRLDPSLVRENGQVYPRVRIFEGPYVETIFRDNHRLDDDALRAVLTFKESGAFDDTEIEASRQAIIAAYQAIAHHRVKVTVSRPHGSQSIRDPKRRGRFHQVIFEIEEGPRVYIRHVEIVGNKLIKTQDLLERMGSKGVAEKGVIWGLSTSAGVVQPAKIINDLLAIRGLYADRGMTKMKFKCRDANMPNDLGEEAQAALSALDGVKQEHVEKLKESEYRSLEHIAYTDAKDLAKILEIEIADAEILRAGAEDLIWSKRSKYPARDHCYEIVKDEDPRLVILKIRLVEGSQTLVDKLMFTDKFLDRLDQDTRDQANTLFQDLGFKNDRNQWVPTGFNPQKTDAVKGFVLSCLLRDGYLSPSVTIQCPLPGDTETKCTDERLGGKRFPKIVFAIDRGRQTRAQGVLLRGLLRTNPEVLENELLFRRGDALGSDEIFNSQASIRSLGIFETVNLELIDQGDLDGEEESNGATVVVTVEESSAISLDLGGGFRLEQDESSENTVIIDTALDLKDKNFWGNALVVGVKAEYANAPTYFFSDDEYDQATTRITLPYIVDSRLFGSRVAWDMSLKLDQGLTGQRDDFIRNWGVETNFSYDFFNLSRPAEWGRGLFARFGMEYGYQKSRPVRSEDSPQAPYGEYKHSLTLSTPVTWERRDNPIHPTRGFWLELRPELVFVRPEFFSTDESARQLPKKVSVSGQWVISFFDKRLVMVPFLRLGAAFIDDEDDEPKPDFFFKAGGDGVTHPIRGYDDASVEACNGQDAATGICRAVYPVGVTADDRVVDPETIGGRALLLGSFEARVPLDPGTGFWLAGYLDFGAVGEDWGAISDALGELFVSESPEDEDASVDQDKSLVGGTEIRASVGAGIRWLIGGIIPLRLDAAYPLSATVFSDQTWRFHFNIGYPL